MNLEKQKERNRRKEKRIWWPFQSFQKPCTIKKFQKTNTAFIPSESFPLHKFVPVLVAAFSASAQL
jgi:hypothetical protein